MGGILNQFTFYANGATGSSLTFFETTVEKACKLTLKQYWWNNGGWQQSVYSITITINGTQVYQGAGFPIEVDIPANGVVAISTDTGANNYYRKYEFTFE